MRSARSTIPNGWCWEVGFLKIDLRFLSSTIFTPSILLNIFPTCSRFVFFFVVTMPLGTMAVPVITLYLLLLSSLIPQTLCNSPASPSPFGPNESSADTTNFITKVVDGNGTDISSGFQTLIFEETPPASGSNLTDRQVPWMRVIGSCRQPEAVFRWSYCRRPLGTVADMEAFTVICTLQSPGPPHLNSRTIIEHGTCAESEVCMDGPMRPNPFSWGGRRLHTRARCIGKSGFRLFSEFLNSQDKFGSTPWEHEKTMEMRISFPDQEHPLTAEKIDVDMLSRGEEASQTPKNKSCLDCDRLAVTNGDEELSLLKTQATVQGATAGVLWIAFMSSVLG